MNPPRSFDLSEESSRKVAVMDRGRLQRLLRARHLYSIGYGDVGSSIYYALGVTVLYALGAAPLAILFAVGIFACTVLTYTELSAAIPEPGGAQLFARRAFGDVASFLSGWALFLAYVLTASISAYTVAPYLGNFWPVLKTPTAAVMFATILILFLAFLNFIGIRESAGLSLTLTAVDVFTMTMIIVVGIWKVLDWNRLWSGFRLLGEMPTWTQFLYGLLIANVAFIGIEAATQLAGEARDPGRTVPRATLGVLLTVGIAFPLLSMVALSAMSPQVLVEKYLEDPLAGIAQELPGVGRFLLPWVALLGATILTVATNAGIVGASRLSYSMASDLQLPNLFRTLHPRFGTPHFGLLLVLIPSVAVLWIVRTQPQPLKVLADLYLFGATMGIFLTHLSLIGLRVREPALERPFRIPGEIPFGRHRIPVTAIVGAAVIFSAWAYVVVTRPHTRTLGFFWVLSGLFLFIHYRRKLGLPETKTLEISRMEVPEFHDLKLAKVLVATRGGASTETVQVAARVAKEHGAVLTALYAIEVPAQLELDFFDARKLEEADAALARAEAIGREFGIPVETKLIQSRFAGESIVETARTEGIDLIVLGCSPRFSPGPGPSVGLGRTVEHVLRYSPCRVWLCTQPPVAAGSIKSPP